MRKRIILATIALNNMAGGLEKNIIYLANHLAGLGLQVSLATFDLQGAQAFYQIDSRVKWYKLGVGQPHQPVDFANRLRIIYRLRKVLASSGDETTLVCFHHGILARYLAASLFCGIKIICSERNSLSLYEYIKKPKWNINFLLLYLTDCITVQFQSYVDSYPNLLRKKIISIHNPVFKYNRSNNNTRDKIILSIGRFGHQKQFELLLFACQQVFIKHPDWKLVIIGDGERKDYIKRQIKHCSLSRKVDLIEPVNDLNPFFSKASFYCQPSLWEGFPNAMAEAMAAGVVPIGFSRTSGVADIIEDGVNGYLCHENFSPNALANTLNYAIDNQSDYDRISNNSAMVAVKYAPKSWLSLWRGVLGV